MAKDPARKIIFVAHSLGGVIVKEVSDNRKSFDLFPTNVSETRSYGSRPTTLIRHTS